MSAAGRLLSMARYSIISSKSMFARQVHRWHEVSVFEMKVAMRDPSEIILKNFPWSDRYEDSSFLGNLHENKIWLRDGYWELEWALCELCPGFDHNSELRWPIFRIFSIIFAKFSYHLDPNDGFCIVDLEREEIYSLRERVQLVFEGFFLGVMPDLDKCFDERNPLLGPSHQASVH